MMKVGRRRESKASFIHRAMVKELFDMFCTRGEKTLSDEYRCTLLSGLRGTTLSVFQQRLQNQYANPLEVVIDFPTFIHALGENSDKLVTITNLLRCMRENIWDAQHVARVETIFFIFDDFEKGMVDAAEISSILECIGVTLRDTHFKAVEIDFFDFIGKVCTDCIVNSDDSSPLIELINETGWNKADIRTFRTVFTVFDVDQQRSFSGLHDLPCALKALTVSPDDICQIMENVEDEISFVTFLRLLNGVRIKKSRALKVVDERIWSTQRITEYKTMFTIFDIDNSGELTSNELVCSYASMGCTISEKEVDELIARIHSRDLTLTFIEYLAFTSYIEMHYDEEDIIPTQPPLLASIRAMDWTCGKILKLQQVFLSTSRGESELDSKSLNKLLLKFGHRSNDVFVRNVLQYTDKNRNGTFDFIEFLLAFSKIRMGLAVHASSPDTITEFFDLRDFVLAVAMWLTRRHKNRPRTSRRLALQTLISQTEWDQSRRAYTVKKMLSGINTILHFMQSLSLQIKLQDLVFDHVNADAASDQSSSITQAPNVSKVTVSRGYARSFDRWMGLQRCRMGASGRVCRSLPPRTNSVVCARTSDIKSFHTNINLASTEFRGNTLRELRGKPTLPPVCDMEPIKNVLPKWPPARAMKGMRKPPPVGPSGWLADPDPVTPPPRNLPLLPRQIPLLDEAESAQRLMEAQAQRLPVLSTYSPDQSLFHREQAWQRDLPIGDVRLYPSVNTHCWPEELFLKHNTRQSLSCLATLPPWITDDGLQAVADTMESCEVTDRKEIHLEGNRLTHLSCEAFRKIFEKTPACESLCLRDGKGLGGRKEGIIDILKSAPKSLQQLDVSGITLGPSSWLRLVEVLMRCTNITDLCVADMHLGFSSQQTIVKVMAGLGILGRLKKIDLSHNSFQYQGCHSLIEFLDESAITHLSIAHNAGGHTGCDTSPDSYNPLLILIERLLSVPRLTTLDMTSCALTYPCLFVLEGSLYQHPAMETLIIGNNPTGWQGMECIIRLAARSTRICTLSCENARTSENKYARFPFHNPSGEYQLDMRSPYSREFARQCVVRCEDKNVPLDIALPYIRCGSTIAPADLQAFTRSTNPTGTLTMRVNSAQELEGATNTLMLERWHKQRAVKVSMRRFVVLAQLWKQCVSDDATYMFLKALPLVALIKLGHVKWLATNSRAGSDVGELIRYLLPAAEGEILQFIDMAPKIASRVKFMREVENLFYFNPECPTGRYVLHMSELVDHELGLRVLVLNLWEKKLALANNFADVSPLQDRQNIANFSINSKPVVFTDDLILPDKDSGAVVSFDFSAPRRIYTNPEYVDGVDFEMLVDTYVSCPCLCYSKINALRKIAHGIVLSVDQFRSLLELALKERTIREVVLACLENLNEPHIEFFVLFFNQCPERHSVCSPHLLYDPHYFSQNHVDILAQRLFRLNIFDYLNVCQIPVPIYDEKRSIVSNNGNRHTCTLSVPDERRLMQYICRISLVEVGDHLCNVTYTESSYLKAKNAANTDEAGAYVIPSTWLTDVPQIGTVAVDYVCDDPKSKLLEERRKGAATYGNWAFQ